MTSAVTADEEAFRYVIDKIVTHELHPGDRIYEPDLAKDLGLSRTPIRHAISRLIAEGVLEKVSGQKGYRIPRLSKEDMEQVFDVRLALEGRAALLAAKNCDSDDIRILRDLNRREKVLFQEGNRKGEYAEINERIHRYIVKMSGNVYIQRYFDQAYWRSSLYTFHLGGFYIAGSDLEVTISDSDGKYRSYVEHEKLIDAIERGEAEVARTLMEEHLWKTFAFRVARSLF